MFGTSKPPFFQNLYARALKHDKARDAYARDGVPLADEFRAQAAALNHVKNDPDFSAVGWSLLLWVRTETNCLPGGSLELGALFLKRQTELLNDLVYFCALTFGESNLRCVAVRFVHE